jgi:hypothetical protein
MAITPIRYYEKKNAKYLEKNRKKEEEAKHFKN